MCITHFLIDPNSRIRNASHKPCSVRALSCVITASHDGSGVGIMESELSDILS
jgi:hypothetical protein